MIYINEKKYRSSTVLHIHHSNMQQSLAKTCNTFQKNN